VGEAQATSRPRSIPESFWVDPSHLLPKTAFPLLRRYVDWGPFWRGGYHTLIQGRTGSGKTTLLLNLLWRLHRRGHRILMRDDGGLDFLYLCREVPIKVWVPKGCSFTCDEVEEIQFFTEPGEVLEGAYTDPLRFHAVLYDCFCLGPGPAVKFYSALFKRLIYRCMQTEREAKDPLVFSFDEINDLVQPKGYELSKEHGGLRPVIEYNVRKLRKHRVTLMATTHRFKQVSLNVRSQFSYIMIKQGFGKDIYDFVSDNMVTVQGRAFWAMLTSIATMGSNLAYVFDYKNSYDRVKIPDIPRPRVRYYLSGEIREEEGGKRYDDRDVVIAALRAQGLGVRAIGRYLGVSHSTVHSRLKKLVKVPGLKGVLEAVA